MRLMIVGHEKTLVNVLKKGVRLWQISRTINKMDGTNLHRLTTG